MKYKIITFIILFPLFINANPVDTIIAKKIALNVIKYKGDKRNEVGNIITNKINRIAVTYIVNFKKVGFVIVSADDATVPVFVYSTTDKYDLERQSPAAKDWLRHYNESVYSVIQRKISNRKTRYKWDKILNREFTDSEKPVAQLLSVEWGQSRSNDDDDCPAYNYYVTDTGGSCWTCSDVCPVGCVAVAMGQIMKYWAHPVKANGRYYNWFNMPDSLLSSNPNYETQRNAIARLLKDIGEDVSMDYCVNGSCGSSSNISEANRSFYADYHYDNSADIRRRFWYSDASWKRMLRENLDEGMPLYYRGRYEDSSGEKHGHAFVCDGYGQINDDDYFHFNLGHNGDLYWCYIDSISPDIYNLNQKAIFDLKPDPDYIYDCNKQETVFQFYRTDPFLKNKFYNPFAGDIYTMGVNVMQGDEVTYTAHSGIKLTNFKVSSGGKFKAFTQPCPSECGNVSKAVKEKLIAGKLTATKTPANKNKEDPVAEQACSEEINNIITIYPNPANNELNVKLNFAEMQNSTELTIYDMFGKKLASKSLQNIQNSTEKFNIRYLQSGLYFMKINTGNLQETRKFLIQK